MNSDANSAAFGSTHPDTDIKCSCERSLSMTQPTNELSAAFRQCRVAVVTIAFASALVNILYLTGAIYMMEVYDRVSGRAEASRP